jgi:hypothetical protein
MTQQAAAQAHEISQVAQAVSEAINGLGEINRLVKQVKESAAPKPKAPRRITSAELMKIATKAVSLIDEELQSAEEEGVRVEARDKDRLLMAVVCSGATHLEITDRYLG